MSITLLATLPSVALIALLLLQHNKNSSEASTPPPQLVTDDDLVMVSTPTRPIARGERLHDVPFERKPWPKSRLSSNDYIHDIEPFRDSVAMSPLPKFLPIPVAAISSTQIDSNAVVEGIPEGMRAISVKVDAESSVEGWARSGNFVDVILVRTSNVAQSGLETTIIAENVKILSAGSSATPITTSNTAPRAPGTVTLLVGQVDALRIKAAASIGRLTFALRGVGDIQPTKSRSVLQRDLLGSPQSASATTHTYNGFARGPDGSYYVLDRGSRWLKTSSPPKDSTVELELSTDTLERNALSKGTDNDSQAGS